MIARLSDFRFPDAAARLYPDTPDRPWVLEVGGESRCFVLPRGRVVGILRLDQDLRPLPLF
mgnify:CR=1 FL=1